MKRILAALGVTGLALLGATAPAVAGDNEKGDSKITICHATGSDNNPYVSVTINLKALDAHADHWKDIIPANDGKVLPEGQNLDKMDIWKNGCTVPDDHGNGNGDDDSHKITICHATGWESKPFVQITVGFKGLKEHAQHGDDIIPPTDKWGGQNWDETGQATYDNDCVPCPPEVVTPTPPVETPPVETPPVETPPVETPVATPPVETPAPPAGAPTGAVVAPPVAVAAAVTTNTGFNVQTAVAPTDTGLAPWAAGLIVMMLAAAGVAARKVLQEGGPSGNRRH